MMKYTVDILSPVHIGTGKKITPFEWAFSNDRFVVVNMDRILAQNPSRAEDLNRRLDQEQLHFSLSEFLTAEELKAPENWQYSAALETSTRRVLQQELRKAKNMDVDEQIKTTADQRVYLPGSSLKGALRTALAYATFKGDSSLFAKLKKHLSNVDWRRPDEAVNELIFWGARRDPKYDLFKTLRISDSSTLPATPDTLNIGKMKILSLRESKKTSGAAPPAQQGTMYAQLQALRTLSESSEQLPLKFWWTIQEVLQPGNTFSGQIEVQERLLTDQAMRKTLGWNAPHQKAFDLNALVRAANTFAMDICDWEMHFFQQEVGGDAVKPVLEFYRSLKADIAAADNQTGYLCVGQGAGWHKMTLGMLLEQDKEFDFKALRKTLRLAKDRLHFEYPKSRKLLMKSADNILAVFGWVKLQFH